MTEGNIAAWRIKEGEKFSAGDVLLEIETDKATMDVEAQDDGILMKIMQGDGSKGVQVGARIAVLAEEGDDISSMQLPADEQPKQAETKQSASPEEQKPAADRADSTEGAAPKQPSPTRPTGKAQKQVYPLLPSVAHLIKQYGVDESKIAEMTPTGPNGRLLKGDVLVYLGKVNQDTPAAITSRFEKLSHLDLSNIKIAKAAPAKVEKPTKPTVEAPKKLVLTLPVSLDAVLEVQRKVNKTLGVALPLTTFIERAAEVANIELPHAANYKPTSDELFNQVLGLDKAGPHGSRGSYIPQLTHVQPASFITSKPRASKGNDIIDVLSGKKPSARPTPAPRATTPAAGPASVNFSLTVPEAEKKRAQVFLERVKLVLEKDAGRLAL